MRPRVATALEDKILQRALAEVLGAIYECDFLGFSYGFRPGRSQHHALDTLAVGITRRRVNWVLDADIRDYFGSLDHSRLLEFLERRIADKRVLRLIQRWLKAGVIEDGVWAGTLEGTPQGASISTLLANVYLHYVFDLWVHQWRQSTPAAKWSWCGSLMTSWWASSIVATPSSSGPRCASGSLASA